MRVIDLLVFMGEYGKRYRESEVPEIFLYFQQMNIDERIIAILKNEELYGFACISIGDNWQQFHKKDTWNYRTHSPEGKIVYIELLICKEWNRELRLLLEQEILRKYPQIEKAVWHKWAKWGDRQVLSVRRNGKYVHC